MEKRLNLPRVEEAMSLLGLNNSKLSESMAVSRTIVGEWLAGKKFPRPDKLIRLGLTLKLRHDELVVDSSPLCAVVNFRKKAQRAIGSEHFVCGVRIALLLDEVAEFLTDEPIETPPTLKKPQADYAYVQKVALRVRERLGRSSTDRVKYDDMVRLLEMYDVIPVPVFWGKNSEREHDAHCMHVQSPRSKREWVYINLDSLVFDFKFWVAHEIGHVLTVDSCTEDISEKFADMFAQAFLFSEQAASAAYDSLVKLSAPELVINLISISSELDIAPYTVYKSVNAYAVSKNIPELQKIGRSYAVIKRFVDNHSTLFANLNVKKGQGLVPTAGMLEPKEYVKVSEKYFRTCFFKALRAYLEENDKGPGFVKSILDIHSVDAKELYTYLMA